MILFEGAICYSTTSIQESSISKLKDEVKSKIKDQRDSRIQ